MNYEEAVAYIEETPKFTTKNKLEHTKECLRRLGSPEERFKVIHVAGTNGKGSTCAFLTSILREAGYSCGLFTSPHLVVINERFQINEKNIDDDTFLHAFEKVKKLADELVAEGSYHPTYFEFLFLIGMVIFADAGVDYVVLETGLGGKLDATTAVEHPLACVITSISFDHMQYLGNTITAIAGEKAGIIVPGVPVIYDGNDALALKDLFPGEEAFCPEKVLLDNNKDMKNKSGQMEDSVTTDESMKQTISCKKSVFDIEHLKFQYLENVPVLQDINLTIDHRPTAVIGQNGAGKTTLVKLLKGLLKPVGGSIYYGGSDMAEKTVAMLAGEIGYVFQNPDDQIFKYHVIDEVMFGPQNIGMTKEQAKEKAVAALKLVGLEQLADENPYDLELSERKLVAIASVLAMDTKVLILDEPTIAQDWKGRKIIQKMIRDLSSQGKTVIAILHDMDLVAESFERVIVMAHGKVLADGTKEEVFAQKDVLEQARIDQPYLTKLCQQLGYKNLYFSLKD